MTAANPLIDQVGELIIRAPWIGMSRGFWKDPERYLQTYWRQIPGMWVHGDWAYVDADGFWYILGRSDDTIKVAGKRIGPAEIESAVVQHPQIAEAAVIGIPDELKGQAIVCFCVPSTHDPLREEDAERFVVDAFGQSFRPQKIEYVGELPKTRNGKVMRRVIRAAFLGQDEGDLSALDNPAAVSQSDRSESLTEKGSSLRGSDEDVDPFRRIGRVLRAHQASAARLVSMLDNQRQFHCHLFARRDRAFALLPR